MSPETVPERPLHRVIPCARFCPTLKLTCVPLSSASVQFPARTHTYRRFDPPLKFTLHSVQLCMRAYIGANGMWDWKGRLGWQRTAGLLPGAFAASQGRHCCLYSIPAWHGHSCLQSLQAHSSNTKERHEREWPNSACKAVQCLKSTSASTLMTCSCMNGHAR